MWYNQKGQEIPVKRHSCEFLPHVPKFRVFRTLHLPKRYVFFMFLAENQASNFSKRALHAYTTRNKWLKKP